MTLAMTRTALIILIILSPIFTFAQMGTKNFIDQNFIEVTGNAELEIVPDLIYLSITLREADGKNRTPLAITEQAMMSKLQEIGIDVEEDLTVNDLSSRFRTKLFSGSQVLLSKEYTLLVADAPTAGKVYEGLEQIGISNVNLLRFDHSKMDELKLQVKIAAIRDAQQKAENLAKAINQPIGRAIHIEELSNERFSDKDGWGWDGAVSRAAPVVVDFADLKLSYSIQAKFELN